MTATRGLGRETGCAGATLGQGWFRAKALNMLRFAAYIAASINNERR
jgi:sensor c-di-GMP phosphodiesterase-like protein